jgi:hypothetical protein
MSQRVYRVMAVSVERDVRGTDMRRIHLAAVEGEAFGTGENAAPAVGTISELVTVEEAARFQPGELFTVALRPRDAGE